MAVKQVTLPELGPVTLYKRRDNRSIRLSIGADGKVRVTMPVWLPYKVGEQFALSKAAWVGARRNPVRGLAHGQRIGKSHRLYFEPHSTALKVSTRLKPNEIYISHPYSQPPHDQTVQQAAQKACVKALRREAEQLLPDRLQRLSNKLELPYKSVAIKQLKSRWGSCSSERDITLNLFLMQLPWHLIDYVMVHELTHTKVMRHGAPFWAELEQHMPNGKQLRKEIANHQPILLVPSA